ncbi:MAG: 4-diphosphocytidyl-2-C-methyl-D-erythritol kinase [Porticoccaceae bacterium]|nr:MAG: 4-diphosphocytidyl-2-C-methyl-D-erythritol kinase [Porticoccaceae bacterium]
MSELTLPAPGKLNLFLHVLGRRPDGYHRLQTLFQLLDFGDRLTFTVTGDGQIAVEPPLPGVPLEANLAYRAARLLASRAPPGVGVRIRVDKRLPMGGGLGGGSSDAATTLLALNRLWGLDLSLEALARLGLRLGADVPLFVLGHSAWGEGIGEVLAPVRLPDAWYLVVDPGVAVSTARIFAHRELTRDDAPITMSAFLEGGGRNSCQPVVEALYPEVRRARLWLAAFGAARMTGTGACLFARFATREEAEAVRRRIPAPWRGFVARGVDRSPAHEALFPGSQNWGVAKR